MVSTIDSERFALIERVAGLAAAYVSAGEVPGLSDFIRRYYASAAVEDLTARRVEDLAGAARSHWKLAAERERGLPVVRIANPTTATDGWQSPFTVVEIVTDDMPFLVDSVTMELDRHGLGLQLAVHPIVRVRRDEDGHLFGIVDDHEHAPDVAIESFLHIEVDLCNDLAQLDTIKTDLLRVLADVRNSTGDWVKMLATVRRVIDDLARRPPAVATDELIETRALLEWMADHHFTFLGYQEYALTGDTDSAALTPVEHTGMGLLRDRSETTESDTFAALPAHLRARALERSLLVLSKGNSKSTVHRGAYLDYVGIKKFDEGGEVAGEHRFLGLWTSAAYNSSPIDIPVLRHKVASVVRRAGFPPNSHSGKDLIAILETYPRDELFQTSEDELYEFAMGILAMQERRRVRVFVRLDRFERFVSALVYVPRDRYNTALRLRIDELLRASFNAVGSEYTARVTESVLARLHFVLRTIPGRVPTVDIDALEAEIAAASRTWTDDLREQLVVEHGDVHGSALARRFADAFPPAYQDTNRPAMAIADIACLDHLLDRGDTVLRLDPPAADSSPASAPATGTPASGTPASGTPASGAPLVFSIFGTRQLALSDVMPTLTNMGVTVLDEHPYQLQLTDGRRASIERFGLRSALGTTAELAEVHDEFEDAFGAVIRGEAENDAFNALVLAAGLTWREIVMLRAYGRYLRQVGTHFSQDYLAATLAEHPAITRSLVGLFTLRFDPDHAEPGDAVSAQIRAQLDEVTSLDHDRILRSYLHLVEATLRTNWYQLDADQHLPYHFVIKLDPRRVPDLPKPKPAFEIFVYSPRVEGVHLRMGKVARGGIRWSDRREDFRTEILGLVKAQMVKNAVIVPVGAKGGFVVKQPPIAADRDALMHEVVQCYRIFIGALLDVTDNLVGGRVVPPARTTRYDDDDTYLVVAADKGTATFSDIANEIATHRGFWLGDAFASGGSVGYDHKAMGITAKGAWESVRRHFRELGLDPEVDDYTVVGIGDMSGDVFGNGMLLSRTMRLVAAFDHRHIFIDPDPDPSVSFDERQRLFALPRSSWDDYDRTLIAEGGGVFSRAAKAVPLSPELRAILGIDEHVTVLTPTELISAILRAPVTLLWNGGIGTYVKASSETHAEVGDKTNDVLRVDGRDLRCRVVGEGGNLGFTQLGRIEFSLAGGHINTDAIDNSAGVDCSDHEVNIKVLLAAAIEAGDLEGEARNELLVEMTDEVGRLVLADNYQQNRALGNARWQSLALADVHTRYLRALEHRGELDRALEFLPDDETLAARFGSGLGLAGPELAVLFAYAKITLAEELLEGDLPDDPDVQTELDAYFPRPLRERFPAAIRGHALRREILTTALVNAMANRAGISFAFRMAEETGASAADIVRAHDTAWEVFEQASVWDAIAALDHRVPAEAQTRMYLESRKLVERAARWFLRNRRPLRVGDTVAQFREPIARGVLALPALLLAGEARWLESFSIELIDAGVPSDLAHRVARLDSQFMLLDISDVAARHGRSVEEVAALHCVVGAQLGLDWVRDRVIEDLPRDDRWHALARNALRDDAYGEHRAITTAVLIGAEPGDNSEQAYERWVRAHNGAVERATSILEQLREHGVYDFSTLSVALRELRELA
jgi:glutamate dehydrogenase